jgi:hypothetical protein
MHPNRWTYLCGMLWCMRWSDGCLTKQPGVWDPGDWTRCVNAFFDSEVIGDIAETGGVLSLAASATSRIYQQLRLVRYWNGNASQSAKIWQFVYTQRAKCWERTASWSVQSNRYSCDQIKNEMSETCGMHEVKLRKAEQQRPGDRCRHGLECKQ